MGREIRRVPPNWAHPRKENREYQPMFEEEYLPAITDWIESHQSWLLGRHKLQAPDDNEHVLDGFSYKFYAQYESPPDVDLYNTFYTSKEATWYQVYETVSEGTPVTPPFATQQELINYLVENGDFWTQSHVQSNYGQFYADELRNPTLEEATAFVIAGSAPSLTVKKLESGVKIMGPYQSSL